MSVYNCICVFCSYVLCSLKCATFCTQMLMCFNKLLLTLTLTWLIKSLWWLLSIVFHVPSAVPYVMKTYTTLMIFNTPICFHDVRRVPTVYAISLPSWLGNVLVLGDRSRRYMSAVGSFGIAQICWNVKGNPMVNCVIWCRKTSTPHQLLNSSIFWPHWRWSRLIADCW